MCNRLKASATPTTETELNRTFPFAATQVHRRSDWLTTVKGYSKYVWDFETNGSENWYGRNQSFGQLSIYSGRDLDGIVTAEASGVGYDGYDWTHIPGTTVPNLSLAEVLADAKNFQWPRFSNEAFASGVTDGKNGAYTYGDLSEEIVRAHRLIVNATPLGTFPNAEGCPVLPYEALGAGHFLFDLVYNPAVTEFLKRGAAQGAATRNGYDMLVGQAEKAWEIWNE